MSHYFINDLDLKSQIREINIELKGLKMKFKVDNGIFSPKRLDFGSRLLIETLENKISGKCLDLGCGYGPIGIFLSKLSDKDIYFDMVDINKRAIALAEINTKINNIIADVFISDGFSNIKNKYNYIICNPPIRAGKKVIYNFYRKAKEYLIDEGSFYIVIQKKQGMKSSFKELEKIFNKVSIISKKSGYYCIEAK